MELGFVVSVGRFGRERRDVCARVVSASGVTDVGVGHAASHALDMGRVGTLGTTAGGKECATGAVHVVVGDSEEQGKMLSFVAQKPKKGAILPTQSDLSVNVPNGLSESDAGTLSILALNLVGALEAQGIDQKKDFKGKTAVVLGGVDGGCSSLSTQLLSAWGAKVVAVTTSNAYKNTAIGAKHVIDPRKLSFAEELESFDFVLDALGNEEQTTVVRTLRKSFGAKYVPTASPLLLRACGDGLLRGGAAIASLVRGNLPKDITDPFLPSDRGIDVVTNAFRLAAEGMIDHVPAQVVTSAELFEAFSWPRDADTGLRYGLPAPSLFDVESVESAEEPVFVRQHIADLFAKDDSGLVLESADDLKSIITSTKNSVETAVLFVGASWCRRCKELLPSFKALAQKLGPDRPDVHFRIMDAEHLKSVARTLEVTDVPEIIVFKEGKRKSTWLNTKTSSLMELSVRQAL
mmetsp:Transcript_13660/g.19701  ORF Transcript_13660/g.19701 Transcript_13660/m.19701 type:complete len:463 (-) Transcript_13660:288-1676(-)